MKLRTTKNSVRIRIRKSELNNLSKNNLIEESINFGNQVVFKFAILINEKINQIDVSLKNNYLLLSLPNSLAQEWITTNQVSLETHIDISDTEQLHVLVEKDFPCLDRPNEDKSDTFTELVPSKIDAC